MQPYRFTPLSGLDEVSDLRQCWVRSLTALPELFVELAVRQAQCWSVEYEEARVGYLSTLDRTLVQLYLVPEHRTHADFALRQAAGALGIHKAWASTFDPLAMAAATSVGDRLSVLGCHFRARLPVTLAAPEPRPQQRQAAAADIPLVHRINHPEVFDNPADIAPWVNAGWVSLFEVDGQAVGLGLCTPTGAGTVAADVGVLVVPQHQGRGLGAWILSRMADRCAEQGLVATAGCSAQNLASRRTVERAGFIAEYRLLEVALHSS